MIEASESFIQNRLLASGRTAVVFFHTPFCGTCRLAERMLHVAETALSGLPFFKCNINFAPELVRRYEIRSVPCIAIVSEGRLTDMLYRMQAVDELYRFLKPWSADA
ncbi:thioredoxin family protein [Paenibacillus senegalensis]|uniref:thioredoxin family protein n=1 Tax=Paenibacillus senegalensis TaxID=1465766 RepID=UPI0002893879|nr:thioredoxin family protein [Paenibacillus senegalensis]